MTGNTAERPIKQKNYDYDEDGAYCWLYHQWRPWQTREADYGEGWSSTRAKEMYRTCYQCPEVQAKEAK
jgi:hypothetical protein